MNYAIKIEKVSHSNLENINFDAIPFGKTFSDHMFVSDYKNGQWVDHRIVPFGPFEIHPACLALHYGQSIFEGMKASKSFDGQPLLFRPDMHAKRLNNSARRMCMPEFPADLFEQALHTLITMDSGWIPPNEGSALYIRPFMFANGEFFGVRPSDTYRFIIFTGPVGPYYPKPVTLLAEEKYVRAMVGGVGEAKAAGNYGASLLPTLEAQQKGYDQILWLDGKEHKYIEEVGTMNIFFVIDGKVVTPMTTGAILKGITRNSFLTILREQEIPVEERRISIQEVAEAYDNGKLEEIFGAGTAAVVAHVSELTWQGKKMTLPPVEHRKIGPVLKKEIDGLRAGKVKDTRGWIVPVKPVPQPTMA